MKPLVHKMLMAAVFVFWMGFPVMGCYLDHIQYRPASLPEIIIVAVAGTAWPLLALLGLFVLSGVKVDD